MTISMRMVEASIKAVYRIAIYTIALSSLFVSQAFAKDTVLTVPVVLDLALLQQRLNEVVPTVVVNQPAKRHVCIPAEYFTSSWLGIKTKITPEISCDVNASVRRTTPIKLKTSGNSLIAVSYTHLTLPTKA